MNEPDVFDPKLIQRLTRPLLQPGVINPRMARKIIWRSQLFANRLPLLAIAQRHGNLAELQTEQMPIVYAQRLSPKTEIASNLAIQSNPQNPQSDGSKTTVVQAKSASPTPRTYLTANLDKQSGVNQPQNITKFLPIVSSLPPNPLAIQDNLISESVPIVYGKSLSPETARVSNISLQGNPDGQKHQSEGSKTTVVQAKFASPTPPTSLTVNHHNQSVMTQEETQINSLPIVSPLPLINFTPDNNAKNLTSQPPSLAGKGEQDFLISSPGESEILLPSPRRGGVRVGVKYDSSRDNVGLESLPIVDAKPLQSPNNISPKRDNYESGQIPIIYGKSQTDDGVNKLNNTVLTAKLIPVAGETIPYPLPKLIVRGTSTNSAKVNTPLVFSNPLLTAPQASPEVPNRGREAFSTMPINPEIAAVTPQSSSIPNLPQHNLSQVNHSQDGIYQIDIDSLAAKVERKLMRKLIVENERRGRRL